MNCATCGQTTRPLHIGGEEYCSNCGNLYVTAGAQTQPRGLDLSTRRRPVVSARRPAPKAAAHLHERAAANHHVIDLRNAAPAAAALPPQTAPEPVITGLTTHHHRPRAGSTPEVESHHPITTEAGVQTRLTQAKQVMRSPAIGRFAGARLPDPAPTAETTPPEPPATLPPQTVTQHIAMTRLEPLPPVEPVTAHKSHKPHTGGGRLEFSPHHRRLAATATAVVLMGGYIWLNNYPKLAIQTADSKAGIAATMPNFIPSSYTLARTNTSPGEITLKFTSPSATQALTIAQSRTNWDANSLLDNYVSEASDDYAAINGQGLTIYLFGDDNATWVNHGLWYQIEGASQLSRDQILKIAYSL